MDGIRAHPAYGYRRILPKLRDWGYEVGEFVVRRLLKHGNLRLVRSIRKPRLSRLRKYLKQTEYRWLQAVSIRERAKICFSENGAKGNTYMESFNGHFKGESDSLFFDARDRWGLRRAIALQIE